MTKNKWRKFTKLSDDCYRKVLENNDIVELRNHNILQDGEIEYAFIADLARLYARKKLGPGSALDVCCGAGYMSNCLKNLGYHVRAFDINLDAVTIAKQTYPDIDFFVDDAASPSTLVSEAKYDFILIREAHPFSRVCDRDFQMKLVSKYLSMLKTDGVIAIGHARRGSTTNYDSVSFSQIRSYLKPSRAVIYGPYFMFAYKHLNLIRSTKLLIRLSSLLSSILQKVTGARWIEYTIIHKK